MSTDTQRIVEICEQLPEPKRAEVADFAQSLLVKGQNSVDRVEKLDRWLARATGASTTGMTTDEIMALTRGDL